MRNIRQRSRPVGTLAQTPVPVRTSSPPPKRSRGHACKQGHTTSPRLRTQAPCPQQTRALTLHRTGPAAGVSLPSAPSSPIVVAVSATAAATPAAAAAAAAATAHSERAHSLRDLRQGAERRP